MCKFESVEKIKDECRIEQEKCIGKKNDAILSWLNLGMISESDSDENS